MPWDPILSQNTNMYGGQAVNTAVTAQASQPITNGFSSPSEFQTAQANFNGAGTSYNGGYGYGQGAGGRGSFWSKDGGAGMILSGLQTVGNLWNAYQQQKMAKEALDFQKDAFKTNLKNSTQTYNTALEDRIRARHNTEGRSSGETNSYLKEHKL